MSIHWIRVGLIAASLASFPTASPGAEPLRVSLRVDLGPDQGQAMGTLWQAVDAAGRPVAGAGFVDAYNTQDRSDRRMLHVFARTSGPDTFRPEPLPRPSTDAGTYLLGFDGRLFSKGRGGPDGALRVWRAEQARWERDESTIPFSVSVAGKTMAATSNRVVHGDRVVLQFGPGEGTFVEWYQASGVLLVRRLNPPINDLVALKWTPGDPLPLDLARGARLPLTTPGEIIYAFGHQGGALLAASNLGGVHIYEDDRWRTLRVPDGKSFQIYSTLNTSDRMLLGQYPTGELFAFGGKRDDLERLAGWPPVMKGVSPSAREAQTLATYGGDLHVGVWPWGEVWRRSGFDGSWRFLGRLFSHPEPTAATVHPYENETRALDPVLNRWGQRVTSMVPLGDSLYLSTSAKGPNPFEPKFTFLGEAKHLEYGAVYRYRRPGCLAVPLAWRNGPTTLTFTIGSQRIEVEQDGQRLGVAEWDAEHPVQLDNPTITRGSGVFGPFRGALVADAAKPTTSAPPRPLRGAYVHLNRHLAPESDAAEQRRVLARELDTMKAAGINAVMPFISTSSGKAHYDSAVLSERVFVRSDPARILASEARARGMAFHPVVPVVICGGEQPAGILRRHPEWALRRPDGAALGYISPASPEARAWLSRWLREVVALLRPDGIVLDYIRYANQPTRLDPASEARFRATLPAGCTPAEEARRFQRFKEDALTELVSAIRKATREERADVTLSAYCWGPHVASNHAIAQVWPRWVERGDLDMINISGYCHRETYGERFLEVFEKRMADSLALNRALPRPAMLTFALGVNTSHGRVHSIDDIRAYRAIADRLGMDGTAYFTWEYLAPYLDELGK